MDTIKLNNIYSHLVDTDDAFSALASTAFAVFALLSLFADFSAFATLITFADLDSVDATLSTLADLVLADLAEAEASADETFSALASALIDARERNECICEHICFKEDRAKST